MKPTLVLLSTLADYLSNREAKFFLSEPRILNKQLAYYVDDIFRQYDANKDEFLDTSEAKNYFKDATGSHHVCDEDFQEWIDFIDQNNDGLLSWDELYNLAEFASR